MELLLVGIDNNEVRLTISIIDFRSVQTHEPTCWNILQEELGPTFTEIATNSLDDVFDASPAVFGDALYLRGQENLYCIANEE